MHTIISENLYKTKLFPAPLKFLKILLKMLHFTYDIQYLDYIHQVLLTLIDTLSMDLLLCSALYRSDENTTLQVSAASYCL